VNEPPALWAAGDRSGRAGHRVQPELGL